MNSINTTGRQWHRYLTGIAAVTLAATGLLAAPPATADQEIGTGGGTGTARAELPRGIDDVVTDRKITLAQDRIDRAYLYN